MSQGPTEPPGQPSSVADVVSAALTEAPKKKRQRIHYSCAECHRRKHKPCIDRGIAELCHPYGEGDQFGNLHERVRRLEVLVHGLAADHKNVEVHLANLDAGQPRSGRTSVPDRFEVADAPLSASDSSTAMYGMERAELKNLEHGADTPAQKPGAVLSDNGTSWYGELALPSMSQRAVCAEVDGEQVEVRSAIPRSPASQRIEMLIAEGGAEPDVTQSLFALLPPTGECDRLTSAFFRDINPFVMPLHERTFRLLYTELLQWRDKTRSKPLQPGEGARFLPFLSSLFFFMAHASLAGPSDPQRDKQSISQALRYFHAGRRTMDTASFVRNDHIDLVMGNLLASKFCLLLRRPTYVWMYIGAAVRGAQSMGLHRDGSKLGLDQVTTERRRRLWASLYHWEKVVSILVSRPSAIQDAHCDTLPPSNVLLEELDPSAPAHRPTGFTDTRRTSIFVFLALRSELARLMGQIGDMYQDLHNPVQHEDVMRMDGELQRFRDGLPPFLRAHGQPGLDLSHDHDSPHVPFQRYLIHIELNFLRITLHRPYMLRAGAKYRVSRDIAFQVAQSDVQVRRNYDRIVPVQKRALAFNLGGLYRLFNTALIYGIMLLLERDPAEAEKQKEFLESFVAQHRNPTDLCSRREVAVVQMFLAKAREPRRASKRTRREPDAQPKQWHSPTQDSSRSASMDQSLTFEDGETAQSFLTNLGGFGKTLSLFPPSLSNQMPQQFDTMYSAPPLSLDVNGLDLFRPSGEPSAQEVPSLNQPLATYEADALDPWSFQLDTSQHATPLSHEDAAMLQTFQTPMHFDAYPSMQPPSTLMPGEQAPSMDAGLMPWGGFINAIAPRSP